MLKVSTDMTPVADTVDVAIPINILWDCFIRTDHWARWNPCMFWVQNQRLVLGEQLFWVFEPIRWGYAYKLPARAKIVELEPYRKVTWEVTFILGFYARHSYSLEDLGDGVTRFGTWEKAVGPTFRMLKMFWLAHFCFVRDQSLVGAQRLEAVYQRTGQLTPQALPTKDYACSLMPTALIVVGIVLLRYYTRFVDTHKYF